MEKWFLVVKNIFHFDDIHNIKEENIKIKNKLKELKK
jgi:hypothetical protein